MQPLEKINFIIIHHSQRKIDSPNLIKKRHLARGWEDVGYHYLIGNKSKLTKDGKLYKGRSEKFQGAHAFKYNKKSLGICLIGNFDKTKPSKKQIQTLIKFLKEKMKKHKIPIKNILGHRELPEVVKSCPGKFMDMNLIRKAVSK